MYIIVAVVVHCNNCHSDYIIQTQQQSLQAQKEIFVCERCGATGKFTVEVWKQWKQDK